MYVLYNVDKLLHGAEFHSNNQFSFGRNIFQDVLFEPAKEMWSEQLVKLLHLILLRYVLELLLELLQGTEALSVEEVEKVEKFFEVVL